MENIYSLGFVISLVFFISKFIEMRFITKENKPLKSIIIDTFFVYFSLIIGSFILEQFKEKTKNLTEAPVFINKPGF